MCGTDDLFHILYGCRNGDEDDYRRFYELYKDQVYRTALMILGSKHDADDAVQNTFIKLFKCFDTYDSARSIKAWVHRITVNACIDLYRAKKRQMGLPERIITCTGWPSGTQDPYPFDNELANYLHRLPVKLRIVLVLRYLCDMSQDEVASCLHIPVGTVKSRIGSGLQKLRKMYNSGETFGLKEVRS
jgi:RNA polymerase sigma-70 factor (ECF subfamily)